MTRPLLLALIGFAAVAVLFVADQAAGVPILWRAG